MQLEIELERLEAGELGVAEAGRVLEDALAEAAPRRGAQVYRALRGWTGRAMRNSHPATELRGWHEILDAVAARLEGDGDWSVRLDVLKELVFERISMLDARDPSRIVQRRHVRPLLQTLLDSGGSIGRSAILERLGLEQANLTRVCQMLADAGMVRRHSAGSTAVFEITSTGRDAMAVVERSRSFEPIPASVSAAGGQGTIWSASSGVADLAAHRRRRSRDVSEWAKHDAPLAPLPELEAA